VILTALFTDLQCLEKGRDWLAEQKALREEGTIQTARLNQTGSTEEIVVITLLALQLTCRMAITTSS
jgi:hypothetical protein